MRDYGKVFTSFWTSETTRSLTEDGRHLALYLLSSPHTNMIGAFRIPDGYVSEDLQWGLERVNKGFQNLQKEGFATRCETTKWVVIHNFLDWNEIENPNQAKGAIRLLDQVPETLKPKPDIARALLNQSANFKTEPMEGFYNRLETLSKPGTGTGTGTGELPGKPDDDEKTETPEIQIIEKLNQLTGSKYRPVESNLKLIRARLTENHSLDEIFDVIEMKSEQWQGGKMAEYLRPATLFNAEKFNQYVGQLPEWRKEKAGDFDWTGEPDYIEGELAHG